MSKLTLNVMEYPGDEPEDAVGELRAYFDKSWDVRRFGLIYTDPKFMRQFRQMLLTLGFSQKAAKDIDYSEQGMQGDNFVSMDCSATFISEWRELVGEENSLDL